MKNKNFFEFYMGWIFLVTALALVAAKTDLFGAGDKDSNWWAFFLLIPIGGFGIRAVEQWRQGKRSSSRQMTRIALLIIPVFAAFFYPPLWGVIYIPFIALLGIDMILGPIVFGLLPLKKK